MALTTPEVRAAPPRGAMPMPARGVGRPHPRAAPGVMMSLGSWQCYEGVGGCGSKAALKHELHSLALPIMALVAIRGTALALPGP